MSLSFINRRAAGALTTFSFLLASNAAIAAEPTTVVGTVDNSSVIASCSLVFSPDTPAVTPVVVLQQPAPATSTDIRFTFYDALGKIVGTQDVSVQPPPATGLPAPLPSFTRTFAYSTVRCDTKPLNAAANPTPSPAASGGGGGGGGTAILLGVLGGGALLALAVGHGGGGSSSSSPTNSPTPTPTNSPTPIPTNSPTPNPTNSPTVAPTNSPSPVPTNSPTPVVTASPTIAPTSSPTASPTVAPSTSPTVAPSGSPTSIPTNSPTPVPTNSPTPVPTNSPTPVPTNSPTPVPTNSPTPVPTNSPSPAPGSVVLSPATLNFNAAGSQYAQMSTASQSGYSGSFSVTGMTCNSSVATISQSGNTFTVTPVAAGPTCTFTITGGNGMSSPLTVNVTTSSGVIHIIHRTIVPTPVAGAAPKTR